MRNFENFYKCTQELMKISVTGFSPEMEKQLAFVGWCMYQAMEYNENFIANLINDAIRSHDVVIGIKMNWNTFKLIRESKKLKEQFDPVTKREVLETGLYGHLWGLEVRVTRKGDEPIADDVIIVIVPKEVRG